MKKGSPLCDSMIASDRSAAVVSACPWSVAVEIHCIPKVTPGGFKRLPSPGDLFSRPGGESERFHEGASWYFGVPTSPGTFMWYILPSRAAYQPLFLSNCGSVTAL